MKANPKKREKEKSSVELEFMNESKRVSHLWNLTEPDHVRELNMCFDETFQNMDRQQSEGVFPSSGSRDVCVCV